MWADPDDDPRETGVDTVGERDTVCDYLRRYPGTTGVPFRDVLVHMIEEYARHCGHADLLRERIDFQRRSWS